MYRVAPGDTLIGIARQFAVDVDDVSRQNKLDDGDPLKVGALLRLRVKRDLVDGAGALTKNEKPEGDKETRTSRETRGGKDRGDGKAHGKADHREKHHKAHRDQG